MILTLDKEKGRVSLSTKKLEPTPGDMVRDPNLVFSRADEMAAAFRYRAGLPMLQAATPSHMDLWVLCMSSSSICVESKLPVKACHRVAVE